MGGYLSQRCGSCYQLMKLTPMNTLLKLDSSCMTWRSWLLIVTSMRSATLTGITQHDTHILNRCCRISQLFFHVLRRVVSWQTVDSAKSCVGRSISQVVLFRIRGTQVANRIFYIPVHYSMGVHRLFSFKLTFTFRKLRSLSTFINHRMFLSKVFILPTRDSRYIASFTNRRTVIFDGIEKGVQLEQIIPPSICSRAYVQG